MLGISIIGIAVLLFLCIITIIDFSNNMNIPSIISSSMMFLMVILAFLLGNLSFGLIFAVLGLVLWDSFGIGIADWKALIIIGLSLNSLLGVVCFVLIFLITHICFTIYITYATKNNKSKKPYLIVLLISYLFLLVLNLFAGVLI